ncbi:hypothetical protein D3C80_1882510 [compost metagenome]
MILGTQCNLIGSNLVCCVTVGADSIGSDNNSMHLSSGKQVRNSRVTNQSSRYLVIHELESR